ncbi:hypothetical protein F4780DRAFT_337332 [Xylariomycetidae sp. FL0641]|nr:hypothetical protein F4780DRAFT_337332 [Xylariomycetidae sp. FL0641]
MSTFPVLAPPSSFQVGLRALFRRSEKAFSSSSTPLRSFATTRRGHTPASCSHYSSWSARGPARLLRNHRPQPFLPEIQIRTIFRFRATTHYNELPESYEDAAGLPFRREDLNQREVDQIFGPGMPAAKANELLRIMHGRRVAGTLEDPTLQVNTDRFRPSEKATALAYLRKHIPVPESINAGLRAEDELQAIEAEEKAREDAEEQFEETSPQQPPSNAPEESAKAPTGRLPNRRKSDSPYGESNFDRIRAQNIAKREAQEKLEEEERLKREEELAKENIGGLQNEQANQPRAISPWRQHYLKHATSDLEAPPEMSAWQRLWPTLGMGVVIVAVCVMSALWHKPPRRSERLFPDMPPAAATCMALLALNTAVYWLWKFPPAWAMLNQYFLVVAATPRPLQLIGAVFSHQNSGHLLVNMVAMWFFGTRLHDDIGRANFLALYIASGALAFSASLATFVLWRGLHYTTCGASGAIYGVIAAYFWTHRFEEFKVFGLPPDPLSGPQGLGFLALVAGLEVAACFSKKRHFIDLPSHFAGMATGLVAAEVIRHHRQAQGRARAERLKNLEVALSDAPELRREKGGER